MVNRFRENSDVKEVVGEREGATGRTLYLARPLRINDEACLECHSSVTVAPQTVRDKYGDANGFGWQLKDVVGAQIVSVPYDVPLKRAQEILRNFVYLLVGVFVFLFLAVNIVLGAIVVRPVRKLAKIADEVSKGNMDAPEFPSGGSDEIGTLVASFNRLRRSLVEALNMLQQ